MERAKFAFAAVEEVHDVLLGRIDSDAFRRQEQWFETEENDYINFLSACNDYVEKMKFDSCTDSTAKHKCIDVTSECVHMSSCTDVSKIECANDLLVQTVRAMRLPQPVVENFAGDPMKYAKFMKAFNERIFIHSFIPSSCIFLKNS